MDQAILLTDELTHNPIDDEWDATMTVTKRRRVPLELDVELPATSRPLYSKDSKHHPGTREQESPIARTGSQETRKHSNVQDETAGIDVDEMAQISDGNAVPKTEAGHTKQERKEWTCTSARIATNSGMIVMRTNTPLVIAALTQTVLVRTARDVVGRSVRKLATVPKSTTHPLKFPLEMKLSRTISATQTPCL